MKRNLLFAALLAASPVGYAQVTLTLGAALSSVFIRDFRLPNLWGYTPIHLLTALTFLGVSGALQYVAHKQIAAHWRTMWLAHLRSRVHRRRIRAAT